MKKLFVCALAVGLFTACSQEETLSTQAPTQISFAGAFVENATRAAIDPSITNEDGDNPIANFDVWGFMDNTTGKVFTREEVTKNGDDWTYVNTQYWYPEHTYYFAAVAPAQSLTNITVDYTNANTYGLGTINFINENGGEDLLYAASGPYKTEKEITAQPDPVKFTFNHMLSKVKFTFTNGFTNTNSTIKISNITMTAPKSGSIDVAQADWWSTNQWVLTKGEENALTLNFGNAKGTKDLTLAATKSDECELERLTIPADKTQKYTVKFYVQLYQGGVLAIEGERTAEITGVALEIGKAYNFAAELNASNLTDDVTENPLFPITFEVEEVKDWVNVENEKLVTTLPTSITKLTLVSDAEPSGTVTVTESLDGAGHNLKAEHNITDNYLVKNTLRLITAKGEKVSITNLNINGTNQVYDKDKNPETTEDNYGIRAIFLEGEGEFLIDNVTIKNVTYTINDDTAPKTLKVINSYFEGWTSYNAETEGIFENVTFAKGTYGQFRPHGNATLTNCVFNNDVVLDLTKLNAGKVVKLVNCKYGDTVITAENIVSLLGTNLKGYAAGKVAF